MSNEERKSAQSKFGPVSYDKYQALETELKKHKEYLRNSVNRSADLSEKLKTLQDKHEELLSYMPKVPTQPYEKDLAQKLIEKESEIAIMDKNLMEKAEQYGDTQLKLDKAMKALKIIGSSRALDGEDTASAQLARKVLKEIK